MKKSLQLPISLILLLAVLVSCKNQKEEKETSAKTTISDLNMEMESRLGYGDFIPNREILFPLNQEISYIGVPENLTSYVVRSFVLQKNQHYYNQYKLGEISEEHYQKIQEIFEIDQSVLSEEMPNTELLFLIGTDTNGNRVIIPDANQNYDFSDDAPLQFEFPLEFIDEDDEEFFEENQEKFLPRAQFTADYVLRGEVTKRSFIVSVNPYALETEMNFYADDPNEKEYFLAVSFPKIQFTQFEVEGQEFQLQVANNFLDPFYASNDVQFVFYKKDEEVTQLNKVPFQLKDTVNLNNQDFQIESISDDGKKVTLKHLGKNKKPLGSRMGNYFPLSEVNTFHGETQAFPTTDKEFQLLYFWTLEEKRSLKEVPDLKEIDTSRVDIIGFSVDENAGAADRMQYRRTMKWPNYHLPPSHHKEKMEQLKLETYPTYFLLNKDKKIIVRSLHLSEVKRNF